MTFYNLHGFYHKRHMDSVKPHYALYSISPVVYGKNYSQGYRLTIFVK